MVLRLENETTSGEVSISFCRNLHHFFVVNLLQLEILIQVQERSKTVSCTSRINNIRENELPIVIL